MFVKNVVFFLEVPANYYSSAGNKRYSVGWSCKAEFQVYISQAEGMLKIKWDLRDLWKGFRLKP